MLEVQEFDGTWAALAAIVRVTGWGELRSVEPYGGVDSRIGWDTHIVMGDDVAGFTNGPVPVRPDLIPERRLENCRVEG